MEVHPSVPAKTVPEFVAYAKANPDKLNMASGGNGRPPGRVTMGSASGQNPPHALQSRNPFATTKRPDSASKVRFDAGTAL